MLLFPRRDMELAHVAGIAWVRFVAPVDVTLLSHAPRFNVKGIRNGFKV